jgi:hypothetical protein
VGERIEVRGFDLTSVATEVGIAEIVDHDDHEVGAGGIRVLIRVRCGSDGTKEG